MIFETIELISNELLDIDTLQTRINNGEFTDILNVHPFLIMTNKGLCLVQKNDDGISVKINAVVDLSNYVTNNDVTNILIKDEYVTKTNLTDELNKISMPDMSNYVTQNDISDFVKTSDLPIFSFEEDGTLSVTIGDITHRYSPIINV